MSSYRSYQKFRKSGMSPNEAKTAVSERSHDLRPKLFQTRPLMRRIFEPTIGCYFHDLLQQKDGARPQYFHVFIGTNNRYAFAYPVNNRSKETAVKTLDRFISDAGTVVKLTSDAESAFVSDVFINACRRHGIASHIVQDKSHAVLGIIDRFIRTLRDLNQPVLKSDRRQHDDKEFINFTTESMAKVLRDYNNTYHDSIGCTPKQMFSDPEKEKEYITKQMRFRKIQDQIEDFKLPVGTYVRYKLGTEDLHGNKRRSEYSREKYVIDRISGERYILRAPDGKVLAKSRFQIVRADDDDPIGKTFYQNKFVDQNKFEPKLLFNPHLPKSDQPKSNRGRPVGS